jgi:hypothetical protein
VQPAVCASLKCTSHRLREMCVPPEPATWLAEPDQPTSMTGCSSAVSRRPAGSSCCLISIPLPSSSFSISAASRSSLPLQTQGAALSSFPRPFTSVRTATRRHSESPTYTNARPHHGHVDEAKLQSIFICFQRSHFIFVTPLSPSATDNDQPASRLIRFPFSEPTQL